MYLAHIKTGGIEQTCTEHCKKTAELCSCDLESIGLEKTGYLAGLLHDCGKFTDEFSEYIQKATNGESVRRGSVIHSFAGVNYLLRNYHNSDELKNLCSEIIACAIGSHHGLFDCVNENSDYGFDYRKTKQPDYDTRAIEAFFTECEGKATLDTLFAESVKEIKNQLSILHDSCKFSKRNNEDLRFLLSLLTRMLTSSLVDADRRDTAAFMNGEHVHENPKGIHLWEDCMTNLMEHLNTFPQKTEIQTARRELSDICVAAAEKDTDIYRLDIPTGGGKTLSALRFALSHALKHQKDRIFYVSPLLSILEQNAEVIRTAIGHDNVILEHHSDIVNEGKTKETLEQYEFLTDTWDAPIVITTLVQLLNTMFSGKMSSVRRFHSLKNSVIIIDEVQTVPGKMLTLFNLVLNYLSIACNTTFILCSATQPELNQIPHPLNTKQLIEKEVINKYCAVFKRNEIIDKGNCKIEEILQYISELLDQNRNSLVVCNKKSQSTEIYSIVKNAGLKCYHLSAGMCIAHRKDTIDRIQESIRNNEKFVCISTQVIEAGVDISFDSVIRFSAGMDSIVQAAGRCNRNGENETLSPVWILRCTNENLSNLEEIKKAKNATDALLDSFSRNPESFSSDLSSDRAVAFYYNKLYKEEADGFFDFTLSDNNSIYSLLSENIQWQNPGKQEYLMNQAFRSAGEQFKVFDSGQKSVIVPWKKGKEIIDLLTTKEDIKDLLSKAKPYTVSVYEYQFSKLEEIGALQKFADGTVAAISEDFYDENTGIKEVKNECDIQIW